jgi:hypothetical protein
MIIDVGAKYGSHAKILLSSLPNFYRDRVLYVAVRPNKEHYDMIYHDQNKNLTFPDFTTALARQ